MTNYSLRARMMILILAALNVLLLCLVIPLVRERHDQRELAQWYTAADVYVSPSVEETFGMTVLEAALCGTTPLVYRGTACQEVAQAQGGILADRGPEHLAKAILQLQKEKTK